MHGSSEAVLARDDDQSVGWGVIVCVCAQLKAAAQAPAAGSDAAFTSCGKDSTHELLT